MLIDVYKIDGTLSGEQIELFDGVFGIEPNDHVIYLSVKAYLANQRQGTHKTKERAEVSGGGKKPWKQKGRGGARAGTTRSPLWVGGGTIFGPRPRDYRQDLPKKVKALARRSALSYKVKDEQLLVVDDFAFENPKTQSFLSIMKALKINGKKTLLLTNGKQENIWKSGRNICNIKVLEAQKASPYQILNNQVLLVQKSAVEVLNNQAVPKEVVS
ncbi:MAG: 50S ribosomal protein L4 [Ignavibacteria bacterium CG_4_8_14_3_um_filter_37_9]|nr:50S ribosomal protein L4 [Ignavibacteria bacterium]OIO24097.1 MAG: 50S ribosomal protein L4 [Ignavibacteria bacterium CG1_02_37_35]PIS44730.1 MAG: 50S ribosomal protein L4 [Ignavibacteria bacterium CG08_land_8_20_14_0_20_37_9]PIW98322.1 MAG: 50S ribosomal protein L4 [Ignavibacteria bacterium CG_4_8_14_3_um_filter_37_9]PIX95447.1 MAG: 50S ribosomal protein L4 [Ignavibacteria bacterium CG_4_10_14_3_um_filter_37_18]